MTAQDKVDWLNSAARWTLEIWVWTIATILVLVLSTLFPGLWETIAIVYLAVVSNYALVISAYAAREAALAKKAVEDNNDDTDSNS